MRMLALLCTAATTIATQTPADTAATVAALKATMAKTPIDVVTCDVPGGLCEVVSGKNVFYTDPKAKVLVIGHVYDLTAHTDLTERKLAELKAVVAGAPATTDGKAISHDVTSSEVTASEPRISLKGLTRAGAIEWGPAGAPPVAIFTDYHCPYCRALVHELEGLNVRVTEYPISILGTRGVAEQVICAPDKVRAMRDAYAGVPLPAGKCDTHGLDDNEAFARLHGFSETPIIVRSDGAVLRGFRDAAVLKAWLAEAGR